MSAFWTPVICLLIPCVCVEITYLIFFPLSTTSPVALLVTALQVLTFSSASFTCLPILRRTTTYHLLPGKKGQSITEQSNTKHLPTSALLITETMTTVFPMKTTSNALNRNGLHA
ncbi:hypothetical protein ATANTOWER_006725 [Ataeniobius toweri]|uniref:Uncharacterized protein n=1 Tax=Ataeniobius toweri TaxID=208326 RepID=A0ABU7AIN0_9TELE|nr:hypothetical protein [Ataeniobius toweri]